MQEAKSPAPSTNAICEPHTENCQNAEESVSILSLGGAASNDDESPKPNKKKRKKRRRNEEFLSPSKPPPQLGQTNKDILLSMCDEKYRSILYKKFELREIFTRGANKFAEELLEGFKVKLEKSGGVFLKKSDDVLVQVDEDEALQQIISHVKTRLKREGARGNKHGKPQNIGVSTKRKPEATAGKATPEGTAGKKSSDDSGIAKSKDIAISYHDDQYKSIMYQHFKKMENSHVGARETAEEVFELLRAKLSGGVFLKKSGDIFVQVEKEEALQKIILDVNGRLKKAHLWGGKKARPKINGLKAKHQPGVNAGKASPERIAGNDTSDDKEFDKSKDFAISYHYDQYKIIMYEHFRKMETSHASVKEAAEEIFDLLRAKVEKSGGVFFKKGGKRFIEIDQTEALRKITHDVSCRSRYVDAWRDGKETSEENNEKSQQSNDINREKSSGPNKNLIRNGAIHFKTSREKIADNSDVVVSLKDVEYKSLMHKHFKDMETSGESAQKVGQSIFECYKETLKKSGGVFLKKTGNEFVEVDDAEALRKITEDVKRRVESAHIWCNGNGLEHSNNGGGNRSQPVEQARKKHKSSHSADHGRTTRKNSSKSRECAAGATCREDPLKYIGEYIAKLFVQRCGWVIKMKKVDLINFEPVVYRKGCDWKTALEGEDKFTGYPPVAKWAHANGYYKDWIVGEEFGVGLLENMGIKDEPYSIFENEQPVEIGRRVCSNAKQNREHSRTKKTSVAATFHCTKCVRDFKYSSADHAHEAFADHVKSCDPNGETNIEASEQSDLNQGSPTARTSNQLNQRRPNNDPIMLHGPDENNMPDSGPVHIKDDEGSSGNNKNELTWKELMTSKVKNDGKSEGNSKEEMMEIFVEIQSHYTNATAANDVDGLRFYGHLLRFLEGKANSKELSLSSDEKQMMAKHVRFFNSINEKFALDKKANLPGLSFLKRMLTDTIKECSEELPLS
eukprot:CAMPEP_0183718100 /NCGR_PEP_ID=MMETSP0737-20130205/11440_1 /TAXON_ID=385413 /ORGANISM="Thalassiosira miniscula, Strain CCMP1093" /LENGTH=963 /DNA_ID=CAMNT_0025947589 /DNA_START=31 /DNA_END=2925 /DNA_ORIENTATION=+